MKYRIYLVDFYNPIGNTGLSNYVLQLIKELSVNDELDICLVSVNSVYRKIKLELKNGVEHIHFPFDIAPSRRISENDIKIAEYLYIHAKGKTNIVFHFNWINHVLIAPLLKERIKCKILLTKHCSPWRDNMCVHYSHFYNLYKVLQEKRQVNFVLHSYLSYELTAYNCVDHIITVTEMAKKELNYIFNISLNSVTTIYNGISIEELGEGLNKEELRKKYRFDVKEKLILYAGRLIKTKGISELIQAFNYLIETNPEERYRLIICGRGDFNWVYSLIKYYSFVTITGNIPRKQLYEFYRMADVGVVPSYTEQCSYTALEMMGSKLPIVVTNVGGLDEIIDEEKGFKTNVVYNTNKIEFDIQDFSKKIFFALNKNNLSNKKKEKAFHQVSTYFTSKIMSQKTLQVYKSISMEDSNDLKSNKEFKKDNLVSVIIPIYNAERSIEKCLISILKQTYQNLEIILIDDSSSDGTVEIISRFRDTRIRLIRNEVNKGINHSLRKGIEMARGDYIARIDPVDYMKEERLQLQIDFLENNKEYIAVGSNYVKIDDRGHILEYESYPQNNDELQVFKYFFEPIHYSTILLRASIFDHFEYENKYPGFEDYNLLLKISEYYKIKNIPDYTTYCYSCFHRESLLRNIEEKEKMINLICDFLKTAKLGKFSMEELNLHSVILNENQQTYFDHSENLKKIDAWIEKLVLFSTKNTNESLKKIVLQYVMG